MPYFLGDTGGLSGSLRKRDKTIGKSPPPYMATSARMFRTALPTIDEVWRKGVHVLPEIRDPKPTIMAPGVKVIPARRKAKAVVGPPSSRPRPARKRIRRAKPQGAFAMPKRGEARPGFVKRRVAELAPSIGKVRALHHAGREWELSRMKLPRRAGLIPGTPLPGAFLRRRR